MFKDKNLLILTPCYPDSEHKVVGDPFVKSQIDEIKNQFKKVYIISPLAYYPSWIKKIPIIKNLFSPSSNIKDYKYDNIEVYYPKFFHLPLPRFRKNQGERQYKLVNKLLKQKQITFDIIHAHFIRTSGVIGSLLKSKYKKPLVVSLHGSDVRIPLNSKLQKARYAGEVTLLKKNLDYTLEMCDIIITQQPELFTLINENYDQKIFNKLILVDKEVDKRFINNQIKDDSIRRLKQSYGIEKNINILFLAGISTIKDPLTFVNAAKRSVADKNLKFIMIGDGPLLNEIKSIKEKEKLENLLILGEQENNPKRYMMCDMFCALSNIENIWSTTLQEALCVGTPVIVVNTKLVSQYLNNSEASIIPIGDAESLQNTIKEIAYTRSKSSELKSHKNKRREKFNPKKIGKEILELYKQVI